MDSRRLLKGLDILVKKKVFDKSVEDFGKNEFLFGNDASLIPGRLYFIKVRQPSNPGIDTIVMFNDTKGNIMHFTQYYFRYLRLSDEEDVPYNTFQKTNIDIKIPIENDLYIVDITDIIKNNYSMDTLMLAFLGSNMTDRNIVSKSPYSIGTSNTGVIPMIGEYLHKEYTGNIGKGGKTRMKKTSKSNRKKRTKKRHHNKTKIKNK